MNAVLRTGITGCLLALFIIGSVLAVTDTTASQAEPAVYLNFNEGSGVYAVDTSGHGNAGTIHNATRIENGGCGSALFFNGMDNYVNVPYNPDNHPEKEITVSCWFYVDSFDPQVLVSGYRDGGYRLAFADGGDLWWTVSLAGAGDVSVPVKHEGITLRQWHNLAGTYDGKTSRIYLDGVLRSQKNVSGTIQYQYQNYIILGADAGTYDMPDSACPHYFRGGLDEIRIYNKALTYGQVMDDRFHCPSEPKAPSLDNPAEVVPRESCMATSGSFSLSDGGTAVRSLLFDNATAEGTWNVHVPAGSRLIVNARDAYGKEYPDAWYVELMDESGRITRSVAFPNTNNAPVTGIIPSGNATVLVRYFDGPLRFPSQVDLRFEAEHQEKPLVIPQKIVVNPIIVIYTASWATLIAIIVVILWLHKRRRQQKQEEKSP